MMAMTIRKLTNLGREDDHALRELIATVDWSPAQIAGQVGGAHRLLTGGGIVLFAKTDDGQLLAFASGEYYAWNQLAQIRGLVVHPAHQRHRYGALLVDRIEAFSREKGARGIYVDTPVDNLTARAFYEAIGYRFDYRMSEYYDEGLDGVTYLKIFGR